MNNNNFMIRNAISNNINIAFLRNNNNLKLRNAISNIIIDSIY